MIALAAETSPLLVQNLLQSVAFIHAGENPPSDLRTIRISLDDGATGLTNVETVISVEAVHSPPVVMKCCSDLVFHENAEPIAVFPIS